jgi:dihydroneopterin aldolase
LSYSWVAKSTEKLVVDTKAGTLEYLAVKIAKFLLEKTGNVPRVAVSIAKPTAIGLAKAAEVHIERSKEISAPYHHKGAPYVLEESK